MFKIAFFCVFALLQLCLPAQHLDIRQGSGRQGRGNARGKGLRQLSGPPEMREVEVVPHGSGNGSHEMPKINMSTFL